MAVKKSKGDLAGQLKRLDIRVRDLEKLVVTTKDKVSIEGLFHLRKTCGAKDPTPIKPKDLVHIEDTVGLRIRKKAPKAARAKTK